MTHYFTCTECGKTFRFSAMIDDIFVDDGFRELGRYEQLGGRDLCAECLNRRAELEEPERWDGLS